MEPDSCGPHIGRIVYDARWRVLRANAAACMLLGVRSLEATPQGYLLELLQGPGREPPSPSGIPCSRYRLASLPDGAKRGFLTYFSSLGEDIEVVFEPAEWSLGFADQLAAPLAVTDQQGYVVYVNRAVEDLVGLPARDLVGESAREIAMRLAVQPGDLDLVLAAVARGQQLPDVYAFRSRRGRARKLSLRTTEWRYRGLPCGTIWIITDVTDDDEAFRQAAVAVWYRLAATVQHELRNPLQTMQAAVDVMRPQAPPGLLRPLELLEQQLRLVSDHLADQLQPPTSASLGQGRLSDVVQAEVERSAIRYVTRGLTFNHERPPDEPAVRLHRGSMGRVFTNLFRNSAEARADARVEVRYEVAGDTLACTVADNGPGFNQHTIQQQLVEAPRNPTAQLGLVIATSTVEAHGGTITLGNRPEGGALVTIRLPIHRPVSKAVMGAPAGAPGKVR